VRGLDSHVIARGRVQARNDQLKGREATDNNPQYSLSAMPAVNVGLTNFEFPENAVRVLLTGYGVSLAVTESTPYFVLLITTVSLAHLPIPSEPIMARCRPVEQCYPPSGYGPPFPRSNGDRR
jgi:hypothetical protein